MEEKVKAWLAQELGEIGGYKDRGKGSKYWKECERHAKEEGITIVQAAIEDMHDDFSNCGAPFLSRIHDMADIYAGLDAGDGKEFLTFLTEWFGNILNQ